MYLWRRAASERWLDKNESELRDLAGHRLAIIERPNRKRLLLEIASNSRPLLQQIEKRFSGRIQKLSRDWLKRSLRRKTKPLRVGTKRLIIRAGAAFGTGEHATTAMCLKMLVRVTRCWGAQAPSPALFGASPKSFSRQSSRSRGRDRQPTRRVRSPAVVVDLGTGSGILALAAKCLGVKRAIGIDNDPIAISTAKANARLNGIRRVRFGVADVRRYKLPRKPDVITANLFSELLIEILPRLRKARWLILSGILREQERDFGRALKRNKIDIIEVRRRGKWVAVLTCSGAA